MNAKLDKLDKLDMGTLETIGDFSVKMEKSRDKFEKFHTEVSAKLMKIDFINAEILKLKKS